jgi:Zn-dependent protease with chaperone function
MPILRQQHYNRNEVKLVIVVIVFAATLLYYGVKVLIDVIRAALRPLEIEPVRVMGQIVTRAQAPKLWAFVEKVAQRIGAGVPDNIVVGLDEGFFVTENAVRLYNETAVPKGRALYLPLPYMAFMSGLEVAAVVGHELGHFVGEDTLYSQRFAPIYAAAIRHIEAVAGDDNPNDSGWRSLATRPATIFGEMFLDSFHEAVRFWSRKRELAADAVGARAAGAQSVATSLLRIVALEPRVNEALAAQWDTGQTVAGGVLGHVRQLVAAKGMDNPAEHSHNRQPHPFDSHPEVAERLQAVGLPVNDELLHRAMDPTPSKLLQQLGLEAAEPAAQTPAPGDAAQAAAAPVSDINAALQTELTGAAAANRQEKIQALTELVRTARTSQPVAERVWLVLLGSAVLTLCALLAGIALLAGKSSDTLLAGLGALTVGAAGLGLSVSVFRRGRKPALVIRPEGLQLFDQPTVLSWEAINDFGFTETNYTFVVRMDLDAQTPAPTLGVSRLRGVYFKTKRQLQITLLGLGGKRADKVMNTMVNYWRAYHARLELQRMGVGIR